jgi:hypothetical protein
MSNKRRTTRLGNYGRDVAAIARRARERAAKREEAPTEPAPAKKPPKENPFQRILRRIREANEKAG